MTDRMASDAKDFFGLNMFRAKGLMTPIDDVLSISKSHDMSELRDEINSAKSKGYTNFVVMDGSGEPMGQIPVRVVEHNEHWMERKSKRMLAMLCLLVFSVTANRS